MKRPDPFEDGRPIAELRKAVKRYGAVTALEGIDFQVRPGEVVALLGPNGAGKTTAVQLLLGLLRPGGGEATLFGLDPRDTAARVRTGAMLQVSKVPETLKVREHVDLVSSYYPRPLPRREVLDLAGLGGVEDRLFGKLSGGQKQRLLFALALCGNPDLLFLDEPTVGLDVEARRTLWSVIQGKAGEGRSVLLTTHYLEEADALADRVVLISQGRIVAEGTPAEIKARAVGKKVRCRTSLALSELAALPGVRNAWRDGEVTELFTAETERVVHEMLSRDRSLSDLEVRGADLEEAFLALTKSDDRKEMAA
ncbi:MAG TPA: ABC transporter ATP-binding protein [Thermoanaerobaculia bacterium]|nr:ABC transporter ATP-binding protein [Thermoanaerobaculia bacterium]